MHWKTAKENKEEEKMNMRGLSDSFISALKTGKLQSILNLVQEDSSLCLEIRNKYINIYYRGGNLLKIKEIDEQNGVYDVFFDVKYVIDKSKNVIEGLEGKLKDQEDTKKWVERVPSLKREMDIWFGQHLKNEREFQQLIVRENNLNNSAIGSDYFICDIEYTNPADRNLRFDLIAVRWLSSSVARKNNKDLGLSFIELKYGDGALTGSAETDSAGIIKHISDMESFLSKPERLDELKEEMKCVFNQKRSLGLIDNQKDIENFNGNKPEYIFILANHDPASSILKRELGKISSSPYKFELKFAVSNFMGYGLYQQNIYGLEEFKERFKKQIYSGE